jgi:hypothetical protein
MPSSASTVPASAPTPSHLAVLAAQRVDARGPGRRRRRSRLEHRSGPTPPARRATRRSHRPGPGRMTRQRIRQVEQANLHPVCGSLGVFGQVGQMLPRDVLAANERLLVESTQHLLLQRLGRVRLRPQQHPSEFVNRYRWLLRHDPGLPDASPAARREAGSAAVSLRRRGHASPISGTPPLRTRYTAANPFGHVTGAGRRQRTIQSGTQQFVADHGGRAALGSQCGHGGFQG